MKGNTLLILSVFMFVSCKGRTSNVVNNKVETQERIAQSLSDVNIGFDTESKTIHIIVALCDNKYQGIVPVPRTIGNGQEPNSNLYWGAAYGIKTYFRRSSEWTLIKQIEIDSLVLERLIFKHISRDYFIIADAYNGKNIREATEAFLRSSAGIVKDTVKVNNKNIGILGNSDIVAYIGHDGLMDFDLQEEFVNTDNQSRDVIILACFSKNYFQPHLSISRVNPLVWTTGLMAPEAYTIHDALSGYVIGETNDEIRIRAAKAYHKYQNCGLNAVKKLLVTI